MIPTIKTTSYSGLREQIFANLKTCFPTQIQGFEIITADKSGRKTAWVVDIAATTTAVMKGPPCTTSEEALEGLLEATSVLVGRTLGNVFEEFHMAPSEMVGEGFVREDVRPSQEPKNRKQSTRNTLNRTSAHSEPAKKSRSDVVDGLDGWDVQPGESHGWKQMQREYFQCSCK